MYTFVKHSLDLSLAPRNWRIKNKNKKKQKSTTNSKVKGSPKRMETFLSQCESKGLPNDKGFFFRTYLMTVLTDWSCSFIYVSQ